LAVVAQIVKTSKQPEKDLEAYKNLLVKKPEFYTEAVYEVYAKTGKLSTAGADYNGHAVHCDAFRKVRSSRRAHG
jgi:hypothetical protein